MCAMSSLFINFTDVCLCNEIKNHYSDLSRHVCFVYCVSSQIAYQCDMTEGGDSTVGVVTTVAGGHVTVGEVTTVPMAEMRVPRNVMRQTRQSTIIVPRSGMRQRRQTTQDHHASPDVDEITPVVMKDHRRTHSRASISRVSNVSHESSCSNASSSSELETADHEWNPHPLNDSIEAGNQHPGNDSFEADVVPSEQTNSVGQDMPVGADVSPNPPSRRRTYRYVNRVRNPRPVSKMRLRWLQSVAPGVMSDNKIRASKCCKRHKCFKYVNTTFLRTKMAHYLTLATDQRRRVLEDMFGSTGQVLFDGREVCSAFLLKAFKFSRDMQANVRASHEITMEKEGGDSLQNGNFSSSLKDDSTASSAPPLKTAEGQEAIITFLERMVEDTADQMPDTGEKHLPFFRKRDVFEVFVKEHAILYRVSPPSPSYFVYVWKTFCPMIKVRKIRRFSKCTRCEELRAALETAMKSNASTSAIKASKMAHVEMVRRERLEYKKKRDRAILNPEQYCSVIVDGADQSAFGLPHFITKTKSERGHSLKVRLIGLLEHSYMNKLHLYTLTEEYQTGANHVIETIHRFLMVRTQQGVLPSTFYIQLDNTSRENKNRYLFSYLESLVTWRLFDDVQASFLPVGHTHEDIDQTFSRTAERLRSNDAITLGDLQYQLRQTYNNETSVTSMSSVANWSGLCENERCLRRVSQFSQYRYFRFGRVLAAVEGDEGTGKVDCVCSVKCGVTDEWKHLPVGKGQEVHSFLRFTPDLSKTPPTEVVCPPGKEEITKRFASEEGRINSTDKMMELYNMRDRVFRTRSEPFHWNLDTAVELNHNAVGHQDDASVHNGNGIDSETVSGGVVPQPRNDYSYDVNSFVAVKPESGDASNPFWIGQVNATTKNDQGVISSICVHWHETYTGSDVYTAKYAPAQLLDAKGKSRGAWKDIIPTDAVVVTFKCLTKSRTLPANVRNYLRVEFSTGSLA